jgi:hypothetical protein
MLSSFSHAFYNQRLEISVEVPLFGYDRSFLDTSFDMIGLYHIVLVVVFPAYTHFLYFKLSKFSGRNGGYSLLYNLQLRRA